MHALPSQLPCRFAVANPLAKQRTKGSETSQSGGESRRRRGQGSFTHHLSFKIGTSQQAFRSHPSVPTSATVEIIQGSLAGRPRRRLEQRSKQPKIQSSLYLLETLISAVAWVHVDSMSYRQYLNNNTRHCTEAATALRQGSSGNQRKSQHGRKSTQMRHSEFRTGLGGLRPSPRNPWSRPK